MSATYDFVAGDTGSVLRVTCVNDDDDSAIDLTGATVALQWIRRSDGALQSKTMTIVTAASGICSYQFATGELEAPSMRFEVKITDSGSKVIRSLDPLEVDVRTAFA